MKATVEDLSSVKKILHVEIPEDTVTGELDSAYKKLKKTAKIKGFRPGKAPRSVLERMYKKDVNADVTSKLIQDSVFKAIQEAGLKIIAPPKIDPPVLEEKKSYQYDASVEITPEIKDIDFKGLSLKKNMYQVGEQEIEMQLTKIQKDLASQQPIQEERPVQEKDFVLIDYEGFKDDKPFSETKKTENFTLKVGDGTISKEFDDQLIGMNVGDLREITVHFPDDYFNSKLANHTVTFRVQLNQIREEILPDIDDELAKKVGQYNSLEELKNLIQKNLQKEQEQRVEQEFNEQIFLALLERTDFEVPDGLIDMELEGIISNMERSLSYQRISMEDLGITKETLSEEYRDTAEKQVRRYLILNKIMDQEKLELTDDELDEGLKQMADTINQPVEEIKRYYEQNQEKMDYLKHTLLEKQVLGLIIDNGTVEEVTPQAKTEPEPSEDKP